MEILQSFLNQVIETLVEQVGHMPYFISET